MIEEITRYLYAIPRFARTGGLEQTKERLRLLGSPEKSFHYIHVAGTNGKGSVCAYMESCLRNMGYKTGLFTSPHLIRINERIRIGNQEISDENFAEAFYKVKNLIDIQKEQGIAHPTFFEFIYLMAMTAFQKAGIEYGVIETGLGGRLDLTNAVEKPDITVITSIGLDHTAILGDTFEQIAAEKAGIIKAGVPLVYLDDRESVSKVIREKAGEAYPVKKEWIHMDSVKPGRLDFSLECPYFEKYDIMLNTNGIYQTENGALAVTAMEVLKKSLNWTLSEADFRKKIIEGLARMTWPGRMEAVAKDIYVDGAHNDDGIRELVRSVETIFPEKNIYLIFAVAEDKDYREMIHHLCGLKHLKGVMVTEIDNGRRRDFHEVMDIFKENWNGNIQGTYNVNEAIRAERSRKGKDGVLICTGSLYLVGHVKEILGGI
ncbi:MAG: bifunctional folylpolyglutamate synthase/dihydrofolate synthase [Clostridia bacterium]|nr:bifunctional folylpolyglutamate synthase/dihydrofolate synthase [Lachnospiraceae bacterium]NCC00399.1 bifunctional folylpolyglutamate synthase/dihydrofolate synthase [Clostridia bacterium]NCD02598.1 bifunctional folylpolyglutamate synthase/dihydrofolate synthase [Clostridia bacterium]